jgi:plasmid maintenance system killer protein
VRGPVRTRPSARFNKSRAKIGEPIASRVIKTLKKFHQSPESPGLNFEAYKGRPGFFTIRINRNFRILLKEEQDKDGTYYLIVEVGNHDSTYDDP